MFAGLISYCDFDEQVQVGTDTGAYTPAGVITLPGSRRSIVDSKALTENDLDALHASDEAQQEAALRNTYEKREIMSND